MAFLDRFKRKPKVVLPEEVNAYYQSERRERVGVAVILGIVALIATLLIAAGLFFGGRYVYRQFIDNDSSKEQGTGQQVDPNDIDGQPQGDQEVNPDTNAGGTTGDQPTSSTPGSGSSDTPANPSAPQTPPSTTTPAPQTTPALGDTALPRTGDEGM